MTAEEREREGVNSRAKEPALELLSRLLQLLRLAHPHGCAIDRRMDRWTDGKGDKDILSIAGQSATNPPSQIPGRHKGINHLLF